ncbi:V-type ATPase V0 subunit A [Schizosaccharomyces japonicus yFS275]|uniref:V-type proton ATPase subunit a n=1 Tax=Schizosaccharomyces japonicus (strain yFS275 / FY16936) TaxID=402676 RepID=B6JVU9_SCHJY|nr:V-type ATPase V0 subunit A [Schizosaccharomyces japonicus yFS275]EEB05500.2 V-type ATPase V0 subunit A [Schizosaccharomyces japonicus yFS275]
MAPSLYRSENVSLVQLFLPTESARATVAALGRLSTIQFRDLNPDVTPFQRSFVKEIRRLNETQRQLRYFHAEITSAGIPIKEGPSENTELINSSTVEEVMDQCNTLDSRIRQLADSSKSLNERYERLLQLRNVLIKTNAFFNQSNEGLVLSSLDESALHASHEDDDELAAPLMGSSAVELDTTTTPTTLSESGHPSIPIDFVAGVIPTAKFQYLERILWRTLRGNLYIYHVPADLPTGSNDDGLADAQTIFLVFAHGTQILSKIRKISDSLGSTLFTVEDNAARRLDQLRDVNDRIGDLSSVLDNMKNALFTELSFVADHLSHWETLLHTDKCVYQAMNLFIFDQNHKCLIAEGWCPQDNLPLVQASLRDVSQRLGSQAPTILNVLETSEVPPTYHRTNKFTEGFQSIIDSYGIASYREVNHGIVAIVTFPFLFAIMFGDLGHGAIMFAIALAFILNEKKLGAKKDLDEMVGMVFFGRYILLLMGAFSMYTGFLYNDIFSKPLSLFTSGWHWPSKASGDLLRAVEVGTYPIGVDPAWHSADNNLLFMNSYKMKLSVIFGIVHMTFCLFLSLSNYRFFKKKLDIYAVFIPSLIFLESIFGYLVVTIIYKWSVDWNGLGLRAPGLLNMLILMFLSPGTIAEPLYPGQKYVQLILLGAALICVPWLLCAKPIALYRQHKKATAPKYLSLRDSDDTAEDANLLSSVTEADPKDHEDFELGEIVIHQVIHTIEFCLGCISHTASYLRLWALSLAHNQLSTVLWNMTIANGFRMTGVSGSIAIFILFAFWFVITCAVLVAMEGTSAMLHSLRLHWVEGMSKHFEGEGYAFTPFNFIENAE